MPKLKWPVWSLLELQRVCLGDGAEADVPHTAQILKRSPPALRTTSVGRERGSTPNDPTMDGCGSSRSHCYIFYLCSGSNYTGSRGDCIQL